NEISNSTGNLLFHVYDLDGIENGTLNELHVPIKLTRDELNVQAPAGSTATIGPLWAMDPGANRLFWYAAGIVYEIPTNNQVLDENDPNYGHPAPGTVHAWAALPATEGHV